MVLKSRYLCVVCHFLSTEFFQLKPFFNLDTIIPIEKLSTQHYIKKLQQQFRFHQFCVDQ